MVNSFSSLERLKSKFYYFFISRKTKQKFYSVLAPLFHTIFNGKLAACYFIRVNEFFLLSGHFSSTQVPFYPSLKNSIVQNILTWLGWINSAINPFIYAYYNEDFRAAFYRLTFRKICLTSRKKPYSYPISSVSARR